LPIDALELHLFESTCSGSSQPDLEDAQGGMSMATDVRSRAPSMRTAVVAETRLYREGLAQLLGKHPRIDVVGTAGGIESALPLLRTAPDAVLLDVRLARRPRAVAQLVATAPGVPVVAFGVADDEQTVIECAEAGVAGYVSAEASLEELVDVVAGAVHDEVVCPPRVTGTLLRRVGAMARERRGTDPVVRLTARETQIVALIDDGLSNKEIAARLHISLATVKNHIHNLLEKLHARRRTEAAARARELCLRRDPDPSVR
jgi:two-component system, NarL family, nitrate/nitrite response regulator NarL